MPHSTTPTNYTVGLGLQATAMQELRDHANRLIGGLPWITDDVAELVATINHLAEG